MGVDEASVRRGLNKAGWKPYLLPQHVLDGFVVGLDQPYVIDVAANGPGAVTADWHLPLTDFDLVNTFLDHAVDVGATNWLLIAGDLFNLDWASTFDFKQAEAGFRQELNAAELVLGKALEVFDEIVLTFGNHDGRLVKTLGYAMTFEATMKMLLGELTPEQRSRIHISNLDHAIIETPNGPYLVAHPKEYARIPLTTPRELASIHLKHVITGHAHHAAIGKDKSGQFVVAEVGGFFDASKTQYKQRTSKHPAWTTGYGFIDSEGYLMIEADGWSSRIGRRA